MWMFPQSSGLSDHKKWYAPGSQKWLGRWVPPEKMVWNEWSPSLRPSFFCVENRGSFRWGRGEQGFPGSFSACHGAHNPFEKWWNAKGGSNIVSCIYYYVCSQEKVHWILIKIYHIKYRVSYHVISKCILSYREILSFHIMSYHIISQHSIEHLVYHISYSHVISYQIISCLNHIFYISIIHPLRFSNAGPLMVWQFRFIFTCSNSSVIYLDLILQFSMFELKKQFRMPHFHPLFQVQEKFKQIL